MLFFMKRLMFIAERKKNVDGVRTSEVGFFNPFCFCYIASLCKISLSFFFFLGFIPSRFQPTAAEMLWKPYMHNLEISSAARSHIFSQEAYLYGTECVRVFVYLWCFRGTEEHPRRNTGNRM